MPKRLSQADLDEAKKRIARGLRTLPDNFLDCRDLKHNWRKVNNYRPREQHIEGGKQRSRISPLLYRVLECERCGTTRTDVIYARTFERLSVSYDYPETYQMPGVPRGVKSSTILRQEAVRRAMLEAAKAEKGEREAAEA